ncbi:hypothetical protein CRENBAI_003975 [Crenichthys baileyi]|uniref:Uncharacterized protein n=1 Tax=Crenichthys baileyi TaxID=28760 RepID=A0AAV9RGV3_9TELE
MQKLVAKDLRQDTQVSNSTPATLRSVSASTHIISSLAGLISRTCVHFIQVCWTQDTSKNCRTGVRQPCFTASTHLNEARHTHHTLLRKMCSVFQGSQTDRWMAENIVQKQKYNYTKSKMSHLFFLKKEEKSTSDIAFHLLNQDPGGGSYPVVLNGLSTSGNSLNLMSVYKLSIQAAK